MTTEQQKSVAEAVELADDLIGMGRKRWPDESAFMLDIRNVCRALILTHAALVEAEQDRDRHFAARGRLANDLAEAELYTVEEILALTTQTHGFSNNHSTRRLLATIAEAWKRNQ